MRNMSFSLTTLQMRNRTKFVTRRLGWRFLKVGELVQSCEKCMGLKKGETLQRICVIRPLFITFEPLNRMEKEPEYGLREANLEGFPWMTGAQFVSMFSEHNGCERNKEITRIHFEFVD